MRYAVAVAEERSFTRAAERCHVVQSALSHQVKALERELGTGLFVRNSRRVDVTPAGEAFVIAARATLESAERAVTDAAAANGQIRGTLTVGLIPTVTALDAPAALGAFHRAHPDVRINVRGGGSDEFIAAIADGAVDVAVLGLPGAFSHRGVRAKVLARERHVVVVPAEHRFAARRRLRLADLADETFVDFPAGWGTRRSVDQLFLSNGLHRGIAVEIADIPNVINLVRAGFGCAFLGPSMVPADLRSQLKQVRPAPEFTVALFSPPDVVSPSAAVRAFRDLVFARFPESQPTDRG